MSKVMIHPATYEKVHPAVDRAFALFPLDLRGKKELPSGNRFMEYTLFPDQNISVRLVDGRKGEFVMISVGGSIINRTSKVDVGALMLKHGGGGHKTVGTCQVSPAKADDVLKDILKTINAKK